MKYSFFLFLIIIFFISCSINETSSDKIDFEYKLMWTSYSPESSSDSLNWYYFQSPYSIIYESYKTHSILDSSAKIVFIEHIDLYVFNGFEYSFLTRIGYYKSESTIDSLLITYHNYYLEKELFDIYGPGLYKIKAECIEYLYKDTTFSFYDEKYERYDSIFLKLKEDNDPTLMILSPKDSI